jgi:hypothetical protein
LIAYAVSFIAVAAGMVGLFNGVSNKFFVGHNNLKELTDNEVAEALRYCEQHPILNEYRLKVVAERGVVRGDLLLMKKIDEHERKAAEEIMFAEVRAAARTRLSETKAKLSAGNVPQETMPIRAGQLRAYAAAAWEEMNTVFFGEIMAAFEAEAENAGLAFIKSGESGCELGADQKRRLGLAVLKAKMRHISPWAPQADIDERAESLERDGDGTQWTEGIIASLQKQGIAIIRTTQDEFGAQIGSAE